MKSIPVFIIVAAAVVVTTAFHRVKNEKEGDNIDEITLGLNTIKGSLPENRNISFRLIGLTSEVYLWSRYVLAPRYVSASEEESFDTTLFISRADTPDTTLQRETANKIIILENKDNIYHYLLTRNR